MKKRKISKNNYRFMERELNFMEQEGKLLKSQKVSLLSLYEVTNGLNFIRVLLTVGAFLVGMGVLSFVASNWSSMGSLFKFSLIVLSIMGVNLVGFKLETKQPKTARTMHYLGVLFFGAGIFLIGQMFHLGGEFHQAFLLWSIGVLPIGYVLKDRIILVFSALLLGVYEFGFVDMDWSNLPYALFILLPALYWINRQIGYSGALTFVLNGLAIQLLILLLIQTIDSFFMETYVYQILLVFVIGIGMLYLPVHEKVKGVFKIQGHLVHGTTALILTIPDAWGTIGHHAPASILFSFLYFAFVLFLIHRGSLFSIVLLFALIIRFYIDLSLDFMPKSMVFIIGGVILITFGFLFEKRRRKGGMIRE